MASQEESAPSYLHHLTEGLIEFKPFANPDSPHFGYQISEYPPSFVELNDLLEIVLEKTYLDPYERKRVCLIRCPYNPATSVHFNVQLTGGNRNFIRSSHTPGLWEWCYFKFGLGDSPFWLTGEDPPEVLEGDPIRMQLNSDTHGREHFYLPAGQKKDKNRVLQAQSATITTSPDSELVRYKKFVKQRAAVEKFKKWDEDDGEATYTFEIDQAGAARLTGQGSIDFELTPDERKMLKYAYEQNLRAMRERIAKRFEEELLAGLTLNRVEPQNSDIITALSSAVDRIRALREEDPQS